MARSLAFASATDYSQMRSIQISRVQRQEEELHDRSIDPAIFAAVLGDAASTAAVHHRSASVDELCEVSESFQPATPVDLWKTYDRTSLESEGLTSEADFESKYIPTPETLDDFIKVNQASKALHGVPFHLVVTENYRSKQEACLQVSSCSGWWRFSRIGYSRDMSQALLHSDNDDPRYPFMGTGHYVLLARIRNVWLVTAKHMTWIS